MMMKTILALAGPSPIPDRAELLILSAISAAAAVILLVLAAISKRAESFGLHGPYDFILVLAACCALIPLIAWMPWLAETFARLLADPSLLSDPAKLLPH